MWIFGEKNSQMKICKKKKTNTHIYKRNNEITKKYICILHGWSWNVDCANGHVWTLNILTIAITFIEQKVFFLWLYQCVYVELSDVAPRCGCCSWNHLCWDSKGGMRPEWCSSRQHSSPNHRCSSCPSWTAQQPQRQAAQHTLTLAKTHQAKM